VKERDAREAVSQRFPTEREEANQGKTPCRLCLYYIFALQALVASVVLTLLAFFAGRPATGTGCKACCTCVKIFIFRYRGSREMLLQKQEREKPSCSHAKTRFTFKILRPSITCVHTLLSQEITLN
jgi:hypothetical protein